MSAEGKRQNAEEIKARLAAVHGVREVEILKDGKEIKVLTDTEGLRGLATEALRAKAAPDLGDSIDILVATGPGGMERRAQFATLEVVNTGPGYITARTVLTWEDEEFEGRSDDEGTPAGEVRACANATIKAVEAFAAGAIHFTLIGAKEVHVFDHDLIAVLLHSDQHPERRLIGTSLITDGRRRSAALAVLNATNRVVGI